MKEGIPFLFWFLMVDSATTFRQVGLQSQSLLGVEAAGRGWDFTFFLISFLLT